MILVLQKLKSGVLLLKIFVALLFFDLGLICFFFFQKEKNIKLWIILAVILVIVESIIFWLGIIKIYVHSRQVSISVKMVGMICGWIPIVNLIILIKMIGICSKEIRFEEFVIERDNRRKDRQICKTKYPILLVHGVFFRDSNHFNYWGRIPASLEKNGASIYYGEHNSASSVEYAADELADKIKRIVRDTGCKKVNIIAHSKGGLDSRRMIFDNPCLVASLTTINTPHRGCEFADYLFSKVSKEQKQFLADKYNFLAEKFGDVNPDFLSAVKDLTSSECRIMNDKIFNKSGVYYQSVGSVLHKATSGRFPLNLTYHFVKFFDGENDGLVGADSFQWGDDFTLIRNEKTLRGISHADVIDLNRENIDGFDVREFYVQLVAGLRRKGF